MTNLRRDPQAYAGMRVGLFGGTFDPAHSGHAHVAETALKRLRLDRVWWLVTPQNPLKPKATPLATRVASARTKARGSRMDVTDIESRMATRYTVDTVRALQRRYPGAHFVLIVGGDAFISLHRWRYWRRLMHMIPVAIVARERTASKALRSRAFARFAAAQRPAHAAATLATRRAPAWIYLPGHLDPASSTDLRAARR